VRGWALVTAQQRFQEALSLLRNRSLYLATHRARTPPTNLLLFSWARVLARSGQPPRRSRCSRRFTRTATVNRTETIPFRFRNILRPQRRAVLGATGPTKEETTRLALSCSRHPRAPCWKRTSREHLFPSCIAVRRRAQRTPTRHDTLIGTLPSQDFVSLYGTNDGLFEPHRADAHTWHGPPADSHPQCRFVPNVRTIAGCTVTTAPAGAS